PMQSIYWWDGEIQSDTEVSILLKTTAALAESVTERIKALHSYAVPCVVALPIETGNQDFLNWIDKETA
ncbi:MAG: divalent-cation tolerance protein CutA, partial [Rhodospirillales bacterium]|nr:divalent-cation tolerance protein CutA [Rhodospirillales bacterium]